METLMPDEQAVFLTQVNRLADQQLAGLRLTRQDPPRGGWRRDWRQAARAAGLLCQSADDTELMLWSPGMAVTSVRVLRELARHDAGAALMLHREAQGWRLMAELGETGDGIPVLCLNGATGLGRRALARWLRGADPDLEDSEELAGNWGPKAHRLLRAGDWQTALAPVFSTGRLQWWRLDADTHVRALYDHDHAFEGLESQLLSVRAGEVLADASPALVTELLTQEQCALLAIGAGSLDQARREALDYAGQRRQGGRLIRDWPAVQQLLADIRQVSESLDDYLILPQAHDPASLARLLRRRAELATATSRACNQAMQVFGGIGYMRDLGVERLVREANALRVMSGSPLFLPLLAEHLEDA